MTSLPNLIVVGAMKCGTTSLHEYLDLHPSIRMSRPKEVDFFSGNNSNQSLDWYRALFDGSFEIRGESSQNYSKHHHPHFAGAFARMSEIIPDVKLIYVVRDPIERYRSHILYNYFIESEAAERFNHSSDHFVKTGLYHFQMMDMLKYFDLKQILVVDSSDLHQFRHETLNSIFSFLGVEQLPNDGRFDFVRNKLEDLSVPRRVRSNLVVRIASKVAPSLTQSALASKLIQARLREGGAKRLERHRKSELLERYREDTEELRKLLGQKCENWSV